MHNFGPLPGPFDILDPPLNETWLRPMIIGLLETALTLSAVQLHTFRELSL